MNVNFNLAASASHWANYQPQKAETTGAIANNTNNHDSLFKAKNAETAGAIAMFGEMNGAGGHFTAVA